MGRGGSFIAEPEGDEQGPEIENASYWPVLKQNRKAEVRMKQTLCTPEPIKLFWGLGALRDFVRFHCSRQ